MGVNGKYVSLGSEQRMAKGSIQTVTIWTPNKNMKNVSKFNLCKYMECIIL